MRTLRRQGNRRFWVFYSPADYLISRGNSLKNPQIGRNYAGPPWPNWKNKSLQAMFNIKRPPPILRLSNSIFTTVPSKTNIECLRLHPLLALSMDTHGKAHTHTLLRHPQTSLFLSSLRTLLHPMNTHSQTTYHHACGIGIEVPDVVL